MLYLVHMLINTSPFQDITPERIRDIDRFVDFPSRFVTERTIDVWLPEDYESSGKRYPVLYMHDGQNLFSPELSYSGIPWGIDQAILRLSGKNIIRPAIVVGIWNTPKRIPEYMPQKPLEKIRFYRDRIIFKERYGDQPVSDAYLSFIVSELKPYIDANYRTYSDRSHNYLMGSSMGGLISLYAACEFPDIFGGAACLSPSWTVIQKTIVPYLKKQLPTSATHRFYFDYGDEAKIKNYESIQLKVNELLEEKMFKKNQTYLTKHFPGDSHSEFAWNRRVDYPLSFLFGREFW